MITVCRALSDLLLQLPAVSPWWTVVKLTEKGAGLEGVHLPVNWAKFSPGHFQ